MAGQFDDLYPEGLNFRSAAVGLAEQTPYTPSTPLRRPTRPTPRQGDYARERQYRIEGARDRLLRGPDRLGAVGELAADLTGAPALAQHMRARMAGDRQSAVTEGLTGLAQASGFVGLPGRSMRPLLGAARAPAAEAPQTLRAYHGSPNGVEGDFRPYTHFTTDPAYASRQASAGQPARGAVYPVDLPIQNPYIIERDFQPGALITSHDVEAGNVAAFQRLEAAGYDGVIDVINNQVVPFRSAPSHLPRNIMPQTRASDGTILPAQPRETFGRPFSRTAGTSADLNEATRMDRPQASPASETWYRGGAGTGQNGLTFYAPTREGARGFARDLHETDEVAEVAVDPGRQATFDWRGLPWDKGPDGRSVEALARSFQREGYDTVRFTNVESVRGSPADELVDLRPPRETFGRPFSRTAGTSGDLREAAQSGPRQSELGFDERRSLLDWALTGPDAGRSETELARLAARAPIEDIPLSELGEVARYADRLTKQRLLQTEPPPIMVRRNARGGYEIIDGHHRTRIARERGRETIRARNLSDVFPMTQPERDGTILPALEQPLRGGTPEALQRAREQGFDVDTPLYHGTGETFDAFEGPVFLSREPRAVAAFARRGVNPQVLPVFLRSKKTYHVRQNGSETGGEMNFDRLSRRGYDTIITEDGDYIALPPPNSTQSNNIRSRFAAFDPARSGESDLLASVGAPVAAAALFGSRKRRK